MGLNIHSFVFWEWVHKEISRVLFVFGIGESKLRGGEKNDTGILLMASISNCWCSLDIDIVLIWPPPCNSDHQDLYVISRGFLLTFMYHCYREGAISKI